MSDNLQKPISSLGLFSLNAGDVIKQMIGQEPATDIRIINKTGKSIQYQFHGSKHEKDKQTLESGLTKFFVKKPWDGPIKTHNYECELWLDDNYIRTYIYGKNVPRKDNKFEVTEEGIFLIDENRKDLVTKWTIAQQN